MPTESITRMMARDIDASRRKGVSVWRRHDGTRRGPGTDVALCHGGAERGEFFSLERRAGVMRREAAMFRRKAEGERHVEVGERFHLPVEPGQRAGPEAIGP